MIIILTNGKKYSDHCLYFVEAENQEMVQKFLDETPRYPDYTDSDDEKLGDKMKILGTSPGITWRDPKETILFKDFQDIYYQDGGWY